MAPSAAPHSRVSLEEREVHRIYQPWLSAHGSSLNVANHIDSLAQDDLDEQGYQARSSRDKALTAFAQLVALRLDVRRCMISLIDSSNQYILAEATRTVSIASSRAAEDDELWLGSAVLSRPDAICEHCMINTCTAVDDTGATLTARGLVIPDCRLDERFKDRPYVTSDPGIRFYAGVPIYSRNGYMIGAVAVSDEDARAALKIEELKLMQETAQSVIEHLEWARDRVDRFKGERIVRGMASFIEGCTSIRDETSGNEVGVGKTPGVPIRPAGPRANSQRPPLVSRKSGLRPIHHSAAFNTKEGTKPATTAAPKGDKLSQMFARAAEILRQSTLADGAAIFGATATSGRQMSAFPPDPSQAVGGSTSTETATSSESERERFDTNTSDSDNTPTARACKILAFSIADDQARADVESGSALTLGTLERYFALFPRGKTFSFTDQGSGFSSEEDSGASDRETHPSAATSTDSNAPSDSARGRARKRRMDHKELLKKIPGAKTVVFIPLYDHSEERLMAGCFLWTSVTGRMMSLDADLSYLRAFGNSIISEVIRVNMQKNEAAKTTFIASMSHELRSPLHGILGAAEFLQEVTSDAYQSGLVTSIVTCGRTLLDTLNHVLDYSKINKLGRAQMRRHAKQNKLITLSDSSLESLSMTGEFDLGVLIEEVAEAVSAGHAFKKLPLNGAVTTQTDQHPHGDSGVSILLDVSPRQSWRVRTQPGALRRVVMNLVGNSLKYTSSGFVAISLRAQETTASDKTSCVIRIVDSGKGMSEQFQHDRMFVPFSQEDPFQPGTGLGLSIVKSIVDSLGGSMDVKSQEGVGTEIDVHLSLPQATDHNANSPEDEVFALGRRTLGKHLVFLEPDPPRVMTHHISRLEETIRETCKTWFGMRTSRSSHMDREDADIYLYSEPPAIEQLVERHRRTTKNGLPNRRKPVIVVYMSAEEAISKSKEQQSILSELGTIVEVIPQPCGPRKLAKILSICLRRAEEEAQANENRHIEDCEPSATDSKLSTPLEAPSPLSPPGSITPNALEPVSGEADDLVKSMSAAISYPSPPPFDPSTPSLQPLVAPPPTSQPTSAPKTTKLPPIPPTDTLHALLVDDNKINRQLLVMFMRKHQYTYVEAEDGQEALDAYKASCLPGPCSNAPTRRFDVVLMDINMPIMDGMESTRCIREFEKENGLKRSNIIALTGLASAQAQQEAEASGIDVFLPKPVKFAELKKLLTVKPPMEE